MHNHGRSIVLIGMMGAGKSSVGRCLQRRTRLTLIDSDDIVVSKFGMPIAEIFAKHGEEKFREAEAETLRSLTTSKRAIVVTGGGIVMREANLDLLKRLGVIIWLDGNPATLFRRAAGSGNRPLLRTKNPRQAFMRILQARQPLYANIAQLRIDTSELTDEEVAVAIVSNIRRLNPKSGRSRHRGTTTP